MNNIGNIGPGDGEINQTANEMTIPSGICQQDPLIRLKLKVKLHRCGNCASIRESSPSQKI